MLGNPMKPSNQGYFIGEEVEWVKLQALFSIRYNKEELDYYSKMAGFSKFWDGYDNHRICDRI